MDPTPELRWVVRHFSEPYKDHWNIRLDECGNVEAERKWDVKVLQQKWVDQFAFKDEWRDVETVKEQV